ncbi:class I SAM-dependent methyltransferase [Pseudoalteromonas luteoviolacea]|uniref:class I SAM-dependent methyltransferase n=1 Tax=Pseudoalteromonas luteoviolacea TaxID=43657 RepID=UPI001B395FDC|nr:class I SAM-dependent methyltransferase [Pseudoalteromonas luteoviolacea]MBQ4838084.1 class I SAM-dependent methyltransferase [Pseudoalteromonas luteoviolacea]
MPTFTGDEALSYDQRIGKLVPGYELLHHTTAAQLGVMLEQNATILIVGAGTGKEVIELAQYNPTWHFIVQDVSADMLAIADQHFTNLGLSDRVTIHHGPLLQGQYQADVALCLLVMHFVKDDGSKMNLFEQICANLGTAGALFLADLTLPETSFEREAQLNYCQKHLGLSEVGVTTMRSNFINEFYPIDTARLDELAKYAGFDSPISYFKALGFSAFILNKRDCSA